MAETDREGRHRERVEALVRGFDLHPAPELDAHRTTDGMVNLSFGPVSIVVDEDGARRFAECILDQLRLIEARRALDRGEGPPP